VAVEGLAQQLRETTGLVRRVLAQTRARILSGNTRERMEETDAGTFPPLRIDSSPITFAPGRRLD
jgi:hypothetical protein